MVAGHRAEELCAYVDIWNDLLIIRKEEFVPSTSASMGWRNTIRGGSFDLERFLTVVLEVKRSIVLECHPSQNIMFGAKHCMRGLNKLFHTFMRFCIKLL